MKDKNIWSIDVDNKKLRHQCGLLLKIEGEISDPDEVIPLLIPDDLTPLNMVMLIREGVTRCRDYKMPDQTRQTLKLSDCRV